MIIADWALHDRLRVLTLAFETFEAARVAVATKASFAMLGAAVASNNWNNTGLVVHSGSARTVCTAMYEGMEVAMPPGQLPVMKWTPDALWWNLLMTAAACTTRACARLFLLGSLVATWKTAGSGP